MRNTRSRTPPAGKRSVDTLTGNGWLREGYGTGRPWPFASWNLHSKADLRRRVFLQVPPELLRLLPQFMPRDPQVSPSPQPQLKEAPRPAVERRKCDPHKVAREFPAYAPEVSRAAQGAGQPYLRHVQDTRKRELVASVQSAWWEDPVALGSLLILAPPIGLAAVWSSKRYSSDARWALTVMTALTMCLVSAIAIAALTLR